MTISSHRHIARSTLINFSGLLVPTIVSLATVPLYLHYIGEIRYGILLLAFAFLGYFGAFDLGLGRAVAQRIARQDSVVDRNHTFWTAFIFSAAMGIVGAVILYFLGGWLFASVLRLPANLRPEMVTAVPWLAAIVPLTAVISVLAGALEARQSFIALNLSQMTGLIGLQVLPLTVALFGHTSMPVLLAAALTGRLIGVTALIATTAYHLPFHGTPRIHQTEILPLLRFGGWISVSGLVTPFLSIVDRFFVGGIIGAAAVTAYTVPYSVTQRFAYLPLALSTTVFPRFSKGDKESSRQMLNDGILALVAIQTPLITLAMVLMDPFFNLWIGHALAITYYPVAIILLVGVWINGPNYIPHNMLPAQGRPDVMAKFYMVEFIPFLILLWVFVTWFGIYGAAIMWTLRSTADAIFCFWATQSMQVFLRGITPTVPSIGLAIAADTLHLSDVNTVVLGTVAVLLAMGASWWIAPNTLKGLVLRLTGRVYDRR
ncbi:flippase [Acidithiobacillus ferrianus]|uniref:flippase n=1 Tax=Acidithiobacillus ferrianus TaxID=2678518 RepID=UPI0034E4455A